MGELTRAEHLQWAKDRALEQINLGYTLGAWISFKSDMSKHSELSNHIALKIGDQIAVGALIDPYTDAFNALGGVKSFIEGFN